MTGNRRLRHTMRGLHGCALRVSFWGEKTVVKPFRMDCWANHCVPARNARLRCCVLCWVMVRGRKSVGREGRGGVRTIEERKQDHF